MLDEYKEDINLDRARPGRLWLMRSNIIVALLLLFTMLAGGYFRFMGNNWDDYIHFHPDERYTTGVATSLGGQLTLSSNEPELAQRCLARYPDNDGRGGFFDAECSPYNPDNVVTTRFIYGTLPLFMARITAETFAEVSGDNVWLDSNGMPLAWRALNAAADTLVIFVVFLIGMRLHNKWVGLLAAILYACSVFPIQIAHFGTVDAVSNLFVTITIYFAVRAQDSGSLWDYGAFGMALGAALAGRLNIAPLAGLIILVALLQVIPAFDKQLAWRERGRLATKHFGGLVLAGFMTLLIFRLANPYAFTGPSFLGLWPNDRFLDMISQAQWQVSGNMDTPPNWQWVNRIPYLFSWQGMVLWGMGIGLGLTGWFSWVWSIIRVLRGKVGATRNLLLVAWIGVYFALFGGIWVMSMRYYLPLYPALAVLAAWALVELVQRTHMPDVAQWRRLGAMALLVGVTGFTVLWALMFTNIYRHMATFTQASYWVWENVPGDFAMRIDDADADVPLINIAITNGYVPEGSVPFEDLLETRASTLIPGSAFEMTFVAPVDGTVSVVQATRLSALTATAGDSTLLVTVSDSGLTVFSSAELTTNFARGDHPLGQPYELLLDPPLEVEYGQSYSFSVLVSGAPLLSYGSVMATELPWDEVMPAKVCTLPVDITLADDPPSGMFGVYECNGRDVWRSLLLGHELQLVWEDVPEKRDRIQTILDQSDYVIIGTNRRYDTHSRNDERWPMTNDYFDALFGGELGFDLEATFQETFEFGPLRVSDQYLPTYDSPQWLNDFEAEEAFHVYDHPVVFIFKKNAEYSHDNTAAILNNTSLTRTTFFTGYNDPTIYDVATRTSLEVDKAPTHLQFSDEMQEIQSEGGTWSDRFDYDSLLNSNQLLALIVWWFVIAVFGFAAWPLLFMALPALADRGYGFAKFFGMLIVAWGVWVLATIRVPVWSQAGILGGLLLLLGISTVIVWRNKALFISYVQTRWRLLLWMEIMSFVLFVVLILVRLTNPDLWERSYGGEKPMDFAYFNGVLRSTTFPPIDPWYSGGFINYYYFGYVIVGAPTLLLGIVPSLAYNLILPTLFSAIGVAAFSVTFSIVNGWRVQDNSVDLAGTVRNRRRPIGNPWIAGVMALLLAVALGNLDTVRVFGYGVADLGGYNQSTGLEGFLVNELVESGVTPSEALEIVDLGGRHKYNSILSEYWRDKLYQPLALIKGFGKLVSGEQPRISPNRWFWGPTRVISEISEQQDGAINEMPIFTFIYADMHAHMMSMPMMLFVMAFVYNELMTAGRDRRGRWAQILALALGALTVGLFQATNTWDYPTFLIMAVVGLGYAWWLRWEQSDSSGDTAAFLRMTKPIKVRGWSMLLGYGLFWFVYKNFTRWSLLDLIARIGGFVIATMLVALPYTWWFASGIAQFKLWEGKKTPNWAYLDIHGFFLFLIISMLVWETARWLRSVQVSALRGKQRQLQIFVVGIVAVLLGTMILTMGGYPVALIVVPLVVWVFVLFFRHGQSRSMQFILTLVALALLITLGTEFLALNNDNGRQNTIFKFYMQVWLLFSVAGGAAFAWVIANSLRWRAWLASLWYFVFAALFLIAAMFPVMAIRGKAVYRFTDDVPLTLDGLDYMLYSTHWEDGTSDYFDLADDYSAIRWLNENVQGSPVIMEAVSGKILYQWGGRISINTGLPSVVGWDHHQKQQRSLEYMTVMVSQRIANVNAFYTTHDIGTAANILRHYDVSYVIVTSYEQQRYTDTGGLDKFRWMENQGLFSVVHHDGNSLIYRVNKERLNDFWLSGILAQGQ